jgi:hypothetical protein
MFAEEVDPQDKTAYVQCELQYGCCRRQVSWIPKQFAVRGLLLKLKNARGEWEDGWVVIRTFQTATKYTLDRVDQGTRRFRKMLGA